MKIKVGKVLKAQGIRGELKALCYLDDAQMLKGVKQLYLGNNLHTVEKLRTDGGFFYVTFADIDDRNTAENYRGWEIFCQKEDIQLDNGRYFVDDVLGCDVSLDDGTPVGKVVDVLQYGAADVYVCKGSCEISFPVLKDLLLKVDVTAKKIVLSAKRFSEVAVTNED